MTKQCMTTLDKIQSLLKQLNKNAEAIEFIDFEVNVRDNDEEEYSLYKAKAKQKRIKQKLRKQMAKYLEETND